MEQRADPAKVVISNRSIDSGMLADMVSEGRLTLANRRAIGAKQKSDLWDCHFLSGVIAGMPPGHVVIDMRVEPYRVIEGNGRIGAVVDFLGGKILNDPPSDLRGMSLWELGGLDERTINRRVREASFAATCIMPGTGELEFETLAQFLRPWH